MRKILRVDYEQKAPLGGFGGEKSRGVSRAQGEGCRAVSKND
jgi:hypothetical protein